MIIISLNEAESHDPVILAHVTTLLDALKMKVDFVSKPEMSETADFDKPLGNVPPVPKPNGPSAEQVFAQTPPIPAPSTAGAAPSQTAPVVPPVSSTAPTPPVPPAPAPAPVNAAPVPPANASPAASAPGGVTLDKEGLPWDARIHASTKTMTAEGKWRAKKGLNDEAYVNAVKSELRQLMGAQAPAVGATPPVPPVAAPSTPPVPPSLPSLPASTVAGVPQPPTSGVPVPPAGGASDAPPVNEYARFLTEAAQKKTTEEVNAGIAALGVPGLTNVMALAHRHDMIPALRSVLGMSQ